MELRRRDLPGAVDPPPQDRGVDEQGGNPADRIAVEGKARVEELARMLGGAKITGATRKAAEELLEGAR